MKNKKPWQSKEIKSTELVHLGFKEINKLDASRKFPQNINILIKFFYHDAFKKTLIESPLFLLDKTILKNLENINRNFQKNKSEYSQDSVYKQITTYTAFDYLFTKLKIQEIFPHTIMSHFIYTDNRTKTPKQFITQKVIPLNENQSFLNFN
ncbi:MAG: hypothetical protein PHG81_12885 [Aliarcobacter sp.]|nr:hypothetical protein [Aliarcobacter sp.]